MSFGETPITVIGNLTADPEIKFTQDGAALAKFTIAATPRVFDRESNQWRDGQATFSAVPRGVSLPSTPRTR